ncbi:MAG: cell division protein FtsA [Candidatus Korobacteraceae bacterium]
MAKLNSNLLAAIDLGSAKTAVLVAEATEHGLRYRGHGLTESRGSRKGLIVDLEKAIVAVQRAVEQAENTSGAPIENAIVGVAGSHVRGLNSHGGITLGARPREITREDVRHAVERARAISLPEDRQILHLLPQDFILDDQAGIHEPAGMMASKLEVKVHMVTAATSAVQNVVTVLNRAGIHVDDTVFEALACADAVLRPEERDLGACIIDIGAGSTDVAVLHEGAVVHSGVVPVGGDHFTNDVAVGLRTPLTDADKIKKLFGCATVMRIPEGNEIEVPSVGDRPSRLMSQRLLGEVLEPRARELFELVRDNLRHGGVLELCNAGMVMTGGAARLLHVAEIAESVLRKPSRVGYPAPISRMPAELCEPEFAAVIGLVLYGNRARLAHGLQEATLASRLKSLFARRGA